MTHLIPKGLLSYSFGTGCIPTRYDSKQYGKYSTVGYTVTGPSHRKRMIGTVGVWKPYFGTVCHAYRDSIMDHPLKDTLAFAHAVLYVTLPV